MEHALHRDQYDCKYQQSDDSNPVGAEYDESFEGKLVPSRSF